MINFGDLLIGRLVRWLGNPITRRSNLNFGTGFTVTDNPDTDSTDITVEFTPPEGNGEHIVATMTAMRALADGDVADGQTWKIKNQPGDVFSYSAGTGAGLADNGLNIIKRTATGSDANPGRFYLANASAVVPTYAAARLSTSTVHNVLQVQARSTTGDGGVGVFFYDASDTTSTDNGGTILVTTNGRRFKRQFSGPIDARWFGARGNDSTDCTTAINNAILAAEAAGGFQVYLPGGVYRISAQITLKSGVKLVGDGVGATVITAAHFVGDPTTAFPNASLVYGEGAYEELDNIDAIDIEKGSRDIELASDQSSNVSVGDVIFIYNDLDNSFSPARPYYRQGEFAEVREVSGSTITVSAPLYDLYSGQDFSANIKVYRLDGIRTGVRDMSVIGFSQTDLINLISVKYAHKCDFANLELTGTDYSGLIYSVAYDIAIDNIRMFDTSPANGYNYCVVGANVQKVRVSNCTLTSSRIATDFGGGDYVGAVVNRDCTVVNSFLSSNGIGGTSAANMHGNCEYVTYRNVVTTGMYLSGDHCGAENCTIYGGTSIGEAVYVTEPIGYDFYLRGCRVVANQDVINTSGLLAIVGQDSVIRSGGTFVVENTDFILGDFDGRPWRIQQDVGTLYDVSVLFSGIRVLWNTTSANSIAYMFAASGKGWRNVTLSNVQLKGGGLEFSGLNAQQLILENVSVTNSPSYGISKSANASSIWDDEYVRVSDVRASLCTNTGLLLTGQDQTKSILDVLTSTSVNNAQIPVGNATDASFFLNSWLSVKFSENTVGDNQAVQTQAYAYAGQDIGAFDDRGTRMIGTRLPVSFSSVNVYRGREIVDSVATAQVPGLIAENTTAAAAGAQQASPGVLLSGRGWKTDATAASQTCEALLQMIPVQGTAEPGGLVRIQKRVNAGSWSTLFSTDFSGNSSVGGTFSAGGAITSGGAFILPGSVAASGNIRGGTTFQIGVVTTTSGDQIILNWNGSDDLILQGLTNASVTLRSTNNVEIKGSDILLKTTGGTTKFEFDANGDKMGFYGHAASAQQPDMIALVDSTGGSPNGTTAAFSAGYTASELNDFAATMIAWMNKVRDALRATGYMA